MHHYWETIQIIVFVDHLKQNARTCTTGGIQPRGTPSESLKLRIPVKQRAYFTQTGEWSIFLTPGGSALERGINASENSVLHTEPW